MSEDMNTQKNTSQCSNSSSTQTSIHTQESDESNKNDQLNTTKTVDEDQTLPDCKNNNNEQSNESMDTFNGNENQMDDPNRLNASSAVDVKKMPCDEHQKNIGTTPNLPEQPGVTNDQNEQQNRHVDDSSKSTDVVSLIQSSDQQQQTSHDTSLFNQTNPPNVDQQNNSMDIDEKLVDSPNKEPLSGIDDTSRVTSISPLPSKSCASVNETKSDDKDADKTSSSDSVNYETKGNLPEVLLKRLQEPYWNNSEDNHETVVEWLSLQFHDTNRSLIKKPDELEDNMPEPVDKQINEDILNRIEGSIVGMALGDALGAHVEFRPHSFLAAHPVEDLEGGGTWGLAKGQFTDDTSMGLCLANSLIVCRGFCPYDQLVRYKWWYQYGYMSATGHCFDIGNATRNSIQEFTDRQKRFPKEQNIDEKDIDNIFKLKSFKDFNVNCSEEGVAGNGALMRLSPVPLFFYMYPADAVEFSGLSGFITHGDIRAYDACRYYAALIVAALHGYSKQQLLREDFYQKHEKTWFSGRKLHRDIQLIAEGSYKKKNGYDDGIRGKGYIVNALEAALWAFWDDDDSFEKGALMAVNLGDDTDTTAAIYGQLAGAYYGYRKLPEKWLKEVYAKKFLLTLSKWIAYLGQHLEKTQEPPSEEMEQQNSGTTEEQNTEKTKEPPSQKMEQQNSGTTEEQNMEKTQELPLKKVEDDKIENP